MSKVQSLMFKVQSSMSNVQSSKLNVQSSKFKVQSSMVQVLGKYKNWEEEVLSTMPIPYTPKPYTLNHIP